ncbi:MAG: hypothetical protein J7K48_04645 [Thermococcus sp.]|nr:hypothetical protein [Thermococcus sp.]
MKMCVVDSQLRNVVTCPNCGRQFTVRDTHAPAHCPHCGAVISFRAPDFEPFVLLSPDDQAGV